MLTPKRKPITTQTPEITKTPTPSATRIPAPELKRVGTPTITKQDNPIGQATIISNSVTVRKGPGTNHERIGGLTGGKVVQVYEDTGDWLKIAYGTEYGYVMQKCTNFQDQKPSNVDNTPPAGATYTGNDTLKKGSSNKEAVKTLQLYLNKYLASSGASQISVDGDFGNGTWTNLMYYQYTRNLCDAQGRIEVDGVCGPATWNAIRTGAPEVYNLKDPIAFNKGYRLDANCTTPLSCGGAMTPNAAAAFEKLIAGAKAAGHTIKASSTFRAMSKHGTSAAVGANKSGQIELFVDWGGNTTYAAKPGYSNHQSGKAIDISGIQRDNDTSALYKWLCNNAAKYSFKNYPAECWHWDYTGS